MFPQNNLATVRRSVVLTTPHTLSRTHAYPAHDHKTSIHLIVNFRISTLHVYVYVSYVLLIIMLKHLIRGRMALCISTENNASFFQNHIHVSKSLRYIHIIW
ncbi:hypothetical protein O3G_MSEX012781 [Manduca sexta]|uniref:Uncharacterized protein n=1 Tax=Manduca sexta TaxID=7130 RepID=A0A922CXN8_MANSE|nr:hypothetical protein O3G_MSEX012781 [Manduca sexta]